MNISKNFKALLSVLLVICMVFALVPTVFAEQIAEEIAQDEGYIEECTEFATDDSGILFASSDCDEHEYEVKEVIESTCRSMGYTVYKCIYCGDEYIADYTDTLIHDFRGQKVEPTCTSMGYWYYDCQNCSSNYRSDYIDMLPHNYKAVVTAPTCTTLGYTTYTCTECKNEYTDDYVNMTEHNYRQSICVPTCFSLGYANYICTSCGYSYKSDYKLPVEHGYVRTVIPPTCTEYGYTMYNCPDCYDSYISEYVDARGHDASDWIVEVYATIENIGRKHIECRTCKEILYETIIEQLSDKDNSDEDGKAQVGDYTIVFEDGDGKAIFNSEVTIDINDKIYVNLPEGKVINYENPITASVFFTLTDRPIVGANICITDYLGNTATVETTIIGKAEVPGNVSTSEDGKAIIGVDKDGKKETIVVTVTDSVNVVTADFTLYVDEDNNIVAEMAEGITPTKEQPLIITFADQEGSVYSDMPVTIKISDGTTESGITDKYGKIMFPVIKEGYTDDMGKITIDSLNITLNDETGALSNAFVAYDENGVLCVTLSEETTVSYANRVTVTVCDSMGNPVNGETVTIKDSSGNEYTYITAEIGNITAPPLNTAYTNTEGYAVVDSFVVMIAGESGCITNAYVEFNDDTNFVVILPEGVEIGDESEILISVLSKTDSTPIEGAVVTVKENSQEKEMTIVTDENGMGNTGECNYEIYCITVENTKTVISDAETKIEGDNIYIMLPETHTLTKNNQITVTVTDKENTPVADISVTVSDCTGKSVTKSTNTKGQVTVPVKTSSSKSVNSSTKKSTAEATTVETKTQKAYMQGYPDGEFKPEGSMTRAEAVAIFARLVSEKKEEKISGDAGFDDIYDSAWYAGYVGYLAKYDIVKGYEDNTFRPEKLVTRAEFITMAVRYYALFNEVSENLSEGKYADVDENHWAFSYVGFADAKKWLCYEGDELEPDKLITRAEVVSMINRATNRIVDKEYFDKNIEILNTFTDLKDNTYWAFYDILSAANDM